MTTERVDSRPAVEPDQVVVIPAQGVATHATHLVEQGSFVMARCTCGWHSYARRSRPLARREAADHELLQAPTG